MKNNTTYEEITGFLSDRELGIIITVGGTKGTPSTHLDDIEPQEIIDLIERLNPFAAMPKVAGTITKLLDYLGQTETESQEDQEEE